MTTQEKESMFKAIILALIVCGAMMLVTLIFIFFFDPIEVLSWTLGIFIGSVCEISSILLMYLGANQATKKGKTGLFLLFHFLRMGIILIALAVCGMLGYGFFAIPKVVIFHYSIFGCLIGYTPIQIIISIIELKNKAKTQ